MIEDLNSLIAAATRHLRNLALSEWRLSSYAVGFIFILDRYEEKNLSVYQKDVMDEIVSEIETMFKQGEISLNERNTRLKCVHILGELRSTGSFDSHCRLGQKEYVLPEYFNYYVEGFVKTLDGCKDKIKAALRTSAKFCNFMIDHEMVKFDEINQDVVRNFLAEMCPSCSQSMDAIVSYVRRFLRYLQERGILIDEKIFLLLSHPQKSDRKVRPIIEQDNIVKIFSAIDRTMAPGKRDYAILLLATNTGLRAIDIAKLKRTDIHWDESEIRLVQSKTGHPLILPIPSEVKDAIADYILNERPDSDSEEVFIRTRAPFCAFNSGGAIKDLFTKYTKKAGIDRQLNDGITVHGLRRTLGTNMISCGAPVTMVSQVLGQKSTDVTKQYIYINEAGLKRCTLSMETLGGNDENI